ncbi:hypothetical protein CHLRE_08g368226v5 [Chlamydomonas reinhardtii]|uniref:Uncharacterized protein n=1 Tax=Chlamydomonas reinhardtii TaxID=3055 RepID=A0A2K3DH37_CHLRE|nr:uncharacterized protein CHLRE_08g368226v5 [Chlamydomonas reinhardtii]PNW79826.1 hypothetical protein CHLRE_08g368226v5 [Chlamydomonas reinhardtii]
MPRASRPAGTALLLSAFPHSAFHLLWTGNIAVEGLHPPRDLDPAFDFTRPRWPAPALLLLALP